jgi:hypothetical protein
MFSRWVRTVPWDRPRRRAIWALGDGTTRVIAYIPFESLYLTLTHPPDVLGPEGISAVGNGCMKAAEGSRNNVLCRVFESLGSQKRTVMPPTGTPASSVQDAKAPGFEYGVSGVAVAGRCGSRHHSEAFPDVLTLRSGLDISVPWSRQPR